MIVEGKISGCFSKTRRGNLISIQNITDHSNNTKLRNTLPNSILTNNDNLIILLVLVTWISKY